MWVQKKSAQIVYYDTIWWPFVFKKKKKNKSVLFSKNNFLKWKVKWNSIFLNFYMHVPQGKKLNWLKKVFDFNNQKVNMLNKISKRKSWKSKNRKCSGRYLEITRLDFFCTPVNERKKTKIFRNILNFFFYFVLGGLG